MALKFKFGPSTVAVLGAAAKRVQENNDPLNAYTKEKEKLEAARNALNFLQENVSFMDSIKKSKLLQKQVEQELEDKAAKKKYYEDLSPELDKLIAAPTVQTGTPAKTVVKKYTLIPDPKHPSIPQVIGEEVTGSDTETKGSWRKTMPDGKKVYLPPINLKDSEYKVENLPASADYAEATKGGKYHGTSMEPIIRASKADPEATIEALKSAALDDVRTDNLMTYYGVKKEGTEELEEVKQENRVELEGVKQDGRIQSIKLRAELSEKSKAADRANRVRLKSISGGGRSGGGSSATQTRLQNTLFKDYEKYNLVAEKAALKADTLKSVFDQPNSFAIRDDFGDVAGYAVTINGQTIKFGSMADVKSALNQARTEYQKADDTRTRYVNQFMPAQQPAQKPTGSKQAPSKPSKPVDKHKADKGVPSIPSDPVLDALNKLKFDT